MKWTTATFSLTYALLSLAYMTEFAPYQTNRDVIFITSPFNILEVTGSASPVLSFLANFVLVAMAILMAELYSDFSVMPLSAGAAFAMAVAASYIISACSWLLKGTPSAGTSIIGFSVFLYLAASGALDMKKMPAWASALVPSLAAAPLYILHNASWPLHVSGALVFGGLCVLYLSLRRPQAAF
ncbi:MAG: hypothetical protein JRN37_03980 [Nitrososphaerota archaeon]|nr:hypothetical protein [Nitrososphaerota archaeon]